MSSKLKLEFKTFIARNFKFLKLFHKILYGTYFADNVLCEFRIWTRFLNILKISLWENDLNVEAKTEFDLWHNNNSVSAQELTEYENKKTSNLNLFSYVGESGAKMNH